MVNLRINGKGPTNFYVACDFTKYMISQENDILIKYTKKGCKI